MRHVKQVFGILVLCIFIFSGCQKDATHSPLPDAAKKSTSSPSGNTLAAKAKLDLMLASLPTGHEERLLENEKRILKQHPQYLAAVINAISPTPCDANTSLDQWIAQELSDWTAEIAYYVNITGMLTFPFYDTWLFENSSSNQYFGVEGEYNHSMTKTFKDLSRFWNIQSDGIVRVGMHGAMLRDREKIIRTDMIVYGDSREVAEFWADLILTLLDVYPQLRNGDHPIFTFNAYASPAFTLPPLGDIPDKIIMGDGFTEAYKGLGYDDVAFKAILAHEYGHHIQFQLGLHTGEFSPEATRRRELMADAFSAYYLAHSRGASMQWKRVKQFLQVFYSIGDCNFNSNGHHGTPTQRMAAADWAYSVVNNAKNQGHILTSQQFTALFEAQLPILVSP